MLSVNGNLKSVPAAGLTSPVLRAAARLRVAQCLVGAGDQPPRRAALADLLLRADRQIAAELADRLGVAVVEEVFAPEEEGLAG